MCGVKCVMWWWCVCVCVWCVVEWWVWLSVFVCMCVVYGVYGVWWDG